jgi:acetoacetyl-CoA synthetase
MWTHGDLVEIGRDGSARLHGRSDGVLNVNGIRIGPAEVYTALRDVQGLSDVMAVEQRDPDDHGHSRMVLLVVLRRGLVLDAGLEREIRATLRHQALAAHVPALIAAVPELPYTHNGKRSERAARDAVNGDPVKNTSALRNPGCLESIETAVRTRTRAVSAEATPDETTTDALVRIWCTVLGMADVQPDDDFFDLGGTSRQSMTLLRLIEKELGHRLPAEAFLANPTVAGLSAVMESGIRADRAAVVALVGGDAEGTPLILLHDAWGDVDGYRSLTAHLAGRCTVVGIQAELEDEDGTPLSFGEIVQADLARVRAFRPTGPYRLAGYSFGGLVAFELARELRAAGETVEFLGILDVRPPLAGITAWERRWRRAAERMAFLVPGLSENTLAEVLRDRLRPAEQPFERRILFRSARIYDAHRWAHYDGAVTYFRARRRIPVAGNLLSAWRRVAPHLHVVDVPGAHHDMLSVRHAPALAAALSAALAG